MNFAKLETDGFFIVKNALDEKAVLNLINSLSQIKPPQSTSRKTDAIYGVRDLLNLSDSIREFSQSTNVRKIAESVLGENAKVVRAIYFDKTADANWKVPWHQDLTIAVREKRETEGFSAWTVKAGIQHVQPPISILENMLTLRFHLDEADELNGALKVVPKSHVKGRLSAEQIKAEHQNNTVKLCRTEKGDCLLMRPLILHSSSAGTNPKSRRVIHFEFSADKLPNNLEWHEG
jgi:ectoine hydroxylase-related dioxygenase (phytanoyl-CoA dioxygenase family)